MSFLVFACILLALTSAYYWVSLDIRLQPPRQMEYRGMGWVMVPLDYVTYGTDRFSWPEVFKGAGFFTAGLACWWLIDFWQKGLLNYAAWVGAVIFLVLAYRYVFLAVEFRFIRASEDGTKRTTRKFVGWIVFVLFLLAAGTAYFGLGGPGFPWRDELVALGFTY